jgi:hypothetical protein
MTTEVPRDPERFFTEYLPARFAEVRDAANGRSSVGSVTFRVLEAGEWSLRLRDGELEVVRGMEDDVMLQVTVPAEDFAPLVLEGIERAPAERAASAARGTVIRALGVDPEKARLVRHVPGSVLFAAKDGATRRRLLVTPGRRKADLEKPECTIECAFADFADARAGLRKPMDLFSSGKLRISGNLQIAMALAGFFL